jgi:hypothetical protein
MTGKRALLDLGFLSIVRQAASLSVDLDILRYLIPTIAVGVSDSFSGGTQCRRRPENRSYGRR